MPLRTHRDRITGKLIAFEGIDQAGKSSIVQSLPSLLIDCKADIVSCAERQSPLGFLLVGARVKDLSPFLKTYLFASDRAWTYEVSCFPALQQGKLVLWDRYVDSAIAYRSVELSRRRLPIDIALVKTINKPFRPADLTFYVDISVETSVRRALRGAGEQPYSPDFLGDVRKQYLKMATSPNYVAINGERALGEVLESVAMELRKRFRDFFHTH